MDMHNAIDRLHDAIEARKRWQERKPELDLAVSEAIYDARLAKVPIKALREVTGLTHQRIYQIEGTVAMRRAVERERADLYRRYPHLIDEAEQAVADNEQPTKQLDPAGKPILSPEELAAEIEAYKRQYAEELAAWKATQPADTADEA